jgi:MFS family permease
MKRTIAQRRRLDAAAITAAAAALLALAFGLRAVLGLFLGHVQAATGLGLASISLALALSQLIGGLAQPLCGALSDRFGPARVVRAGALGLCAGLALIPFAATAPALVLAFGLIAAAAAAIGSAPRLLAVVSARVGAARRGIATGIVGAGGPIGQLALGPLTMLCALAFGWAQALFGLALLALAALPLARGLRASPRGRMRPDTASGATMLPRDAFADAPYWCVAGSFLGCGFHVAFVFAHMPGVIAGAGFDPRLAGTWLGVLGFANALGAIGAGFAVQRFAPGRMLALVYAAVAVAVALWLIAPRTQAVLLAFAVAMGLTCMATVPPTSASILRLYGARHAGKLLGTVMLAHQVGSFLGVWLGGVAVEHSGGYDALWHADIAVMLAAAALALGIREPARQPLTPDPRRTRPASAPADRNAPSAPAWHGSRSAPLSSRPRAAPSAAAGSG